MPHWLPAHTINFLKWPLRQFSDEAILTLGTVEHQESWGHQYKARISYKERACLKEQTKQDGCPFDSFGFLQMAIFHACFGGAGVVWKEGPVRVSSNWVSSFFFFWAVYLWLPICMHLSMYDSSVTTEVKKNLPCCTLRHGVSLYFTWSMCRMRLIKAHKCWHLWCPCSCQEICEETVHRSACSIDSS